MNPPWIAALLGFCLVTGHAHGAVRIANHQGAVLDARELHFTDDHGNAVTFDSYLHVSNKPVLVALAYFECPGVCTALLGGMVEGLKQLSIVPGRAFEVVVVSIDPGEGSELARAKKESYLKEYGQPDTANGWHFLTGKQTDIAHLSRQLGFEYERDSKTGVFLHATGLFVLTPEGVLSSTLTGVRFSKKLLRVALVTAAGGQMGTFWDRVSSICSAYLPHAGWLDRPERWLLALMGLFLGLGWLARWIWATRGSFRVRTQTRLNHL